MLKIYKIGNHNLGSSLVLRNPKEYKKSLIRRYVRVIIRICGYSFMFELKFRNSI